MGKRNEFVGYALGIGAIELVPEGRKLKSGRISPYFFNSGLFNKGEEISILAEAYAQASSGISHDVEVIFGPAYKGIPLAVALSIILSQDHGIDEIGYAFNRKEAKDHGEGGIIVGHPVKGKRVLIVDDVMTTGSSSGEAVEIVRANGGNPVGCVIAFDRQEKGADTKLSAVQEFEKNYGIPVRAAATLDDLISELKARKSTSEKGGVILGKILEYQKQFGV